MGFAHYYKVKVYVDNGRERYETWKYVFAKNEEQATERVLMHYRSQYDTLARILEVCVYTMQNGMMFDGLTII